MVRHLGPWEAGQMGGGGWKEKRPTKGEETEGRGEPGHSMDGGHGTRGSLTRSQISTTKAEPPCRSRRAQAVQQRAQRPEAAGVGCLVRNKLEPPARGLGRGLCRPRGITTRIAAPRPRALRPGLGPQGLRRHRDDDGDRGAATVSEQRRLGIPALPSPDAGAGRRRTS